MNVTQKKAKISAALVARMVKFYGTIEAAREDYKVQREVVRNHDQLRGGLVLWVADSGRIIPTGSCEVFYSGSPDVYSEIPS